MAIDFLTIPVGSNTSPAYFNARADLPITLVVPTSVNPTELRIQCAVSSGASQSGDSFGEVQLQLQPGTIFTNPFTVFSFGANQRPFFVGPLGPLPTPFFRLFLLSSATVVNTYTVMTARFAS